MNDFGQGNILYIGDDHKLCLKIIEAFTERLSYIERMLIPAVGSNPHARCLQRNIRYHFEGGVAMFKFKNEGEIPGNVRNECLSACQDIAFKYALISN